MANPFKTYLQGVAQRFKTPASPGSQFNKPKTTAAVVPSYNQGNSQNSGALTPGQFGSSTQPIPTANNSATAVSAPKLSPAGNAYVAGLTQTNSPQAPINPTQNNPQQPIEPPAATPQSKAMQDYINAYKSYQDTLTNNADTQSAKKAYNDYVANLNKSIAGVGYQRGAEVPLSLVRGTQAKLLSQAQPEEARLQGEVQIATDAQNAAREAAKTGVDLYGNLLTNEQKQAELKQQQANEDRKFNEDVRQFGLKQAQDLQIARINAAKSAGSSTEGISPYQNERTERNLASIDTLLGKVNKKTVGFGSLLAGVPQSQARNFKAELDTLKANIAFGELTAMREASKTGGALGAVSERELGLLESSLGALDTGQSQADFKRNLQNIKESITRWRNALNGVTTKPTTSSGGNVTTHTTAGGNNVTITQS